MSREVGIPDGLVGCAHVVEGCGDNITFLYFLAIDIDLFVHQREGIADPHVESETDIPLKNVTQFHDHVVRQAGLLACVIKRGVFLSDRSSFEDNDFFRFGRFPASGEAVVTPVHEKRVKYVLLIAYTFKFAG